MPYVSDSPVHGQGVFADKDYAVGDTIELCPYLVTDEASLSEDSILHDYMFGSPDDDDNEDTCIIPLGCAMIYNHADKPNAEWTVYKEDERFVQFFAIQPVKQGDELFHDYGEPYWKSREE